MKPQAIAGVSAGADGPLETVYQSISSSGIGRLIGMVGDSIPVRIGGIKLSVLLFGPILAPFALTGYIVLKLFGKRFVVTNRSVRIKSSFGEKLIREVSLGEIENIAVDVQSGQQFYHAGNLVLLKANGDEISTLEGVPRPNRLRQVILDAREARLQSDASLATIQQRQPQSA